MSSTYSPEKGSRTRAAARGRVAARAHVPEPVGKRARLEIGDEKSFTLRIDKANGKDDG